MKKLVFVLAIIFLLVLNLPAQQNGLRDTTQTAVQTDSMARPTIRTIRLIPFSVDVNGRSVRVNDSLPATFYRFKNLIQYNYNGPADVFRNQSLYQIFDFSEMGLPRYVAFLNFLPHEMKVRYDGHILNDPLNGLYNLRYISLDAVDRMEKGLSTGLNIHGRTIIPEVPYSRIMFRQGDFGYTDLDLQYARKFSDRFSLQLDGMNKLQDRNRYHGAIYHARLYYQIKAGMFSRWQFYRNQEHMDVLNRSIFPEYSINGERDAFLGDVFYQSPQSDSSLYHVGIGIDRSRRKSQSNADSFRVYHKYDRYSLTLSRNGRFYSGDYVVSTHLSQYRIWGTAYRKPYTDSELRTLLSWQTRIGRMLSIKPILRLIYRYGNSPLVSPAMEARISRKRFSFCFAWNREIRYPLRSEASFGFRNYLGNGHLQNEIHKQVRAKIAYYPLSGLEFKVTAGQTRIQDEIRFNGSTFYNASRRTFSYISVLGSWQLWKVALACGGQWNRAEIHIGPVHSGWLQLRYHDIWLNGALGIDAIGNAHWFGAHNQLLYNPMVERFYWNSGQTGSFYTLSYKLIATIKDARLFLEMDNALAQQYEIIAGYPQNFYRVRFGVNWVLWN